MTQLVTNDVLEELKSENNNLIKDLTITLKLLETYRNCLISFQKCCKCVDNEENKTKFDKLEEYFNKVNDRLVAKSSEQGRDSTNQVQFIKYKTRLESKQIEGEDQITELETKINDSKDGNQKNKSSDEEMSANDENKDKKANQSSNLNRRQMKTSRNAVSKRYVCEYCDNKSFNDSYHLVRHIRGCHSLEKPYKCLKCDKKFAFSERLSQHVKIHHKDYQKLRCSHEECDFQTILEDRMTDHLAKHSLIRRYECEVCRKTYLTKYELKSHKQRVHRIFEPRISKEVKKEAVLSGNELKKLLKPRRYLNRLSFAQTADIFCQEIGCGKKFLSEYNLRKHMRTVHSDERPFTCGWPGCESAFKTREGLNCHMASHMNERRFQCDIEGCDKRFNTKQEVHQHKRSHGIKKVEKYPCSWPACGVMCQSAQALTEHVNRHQNIKPFKCDYVECDKTYFTAYELRQHFMKVHDKSESFQCDYRECQMSFFNKRDLAKHRRLHEDVAKFVCSWPECCHTFNTSRELSDHMNRHLDIKANKCNFVGCDRSYFKRAHLNRHIKHCHS